MNMKLYNLFGVGAWEMGCGRGHSVAVGVVDQTILGDWTLLWAYLKQSKIPFLDCLSHILTNGETLRNPTIDCNTACLLVLTECFSCAIYSLCESEWLFISFGKSNSISFTDTQILKLHCFSIYCRIHHHRPCVLWFKVEMLQNSSTRVSEQV